ncbi:MAG: tripartite tricarboxylate transporter substrate binding protein [Burkholderiales bacterium]|nr:tripartite tricarboxylate transporter substrate binding protein [Burkholderiales bacterium]
MRTALLAWLACIVALCTPVGAVAQKYPVRSIKIVAPFSPGGGVDTVARVIADPLSKALGRPVIVENRPGAAGTIGAALVAKAPADGHTLLLGTISTHGIAPSLYARLPYDAQKDFTPISLLVTQPNVLAVHPSLGVRSVADLIRLAKARPGTIAYASSGTGTTQHLSGALFEAAAGVRLVHVPYKGSAPALTDLLGGQVQLMFDNLPTALPHIQAGKLTALAVTSSTRALRLPDVSTMREAGLAGYEVTSWYALYAPARTPPAVAQRLSSEVRRILASPAVAERLREQGFQPAPGTPEQLGTMTRDEIARWAKVVKQAGVTME